MSERRAETLLVEQWRPQSGGAWIALRRSLSASLQHSLIPIVLVAWQLGAMAAHSLFFPPPLAVLGEAQQLWFSGPPGHLFLTEGFFRDVLPSFGRMAAGFALAVVIGTSLGFVIGRSRLVSDLSLPAVEFLRALPSTALIPVFLVLFGTEAKMRIILIAFGSVWPVLLNTIDAAATIDSVQIELGKVLRLPLHARIRRIMLPSAMPKILAGTRVALSISLILMVVSELVASDSGIGHAIADAQQLFEFRKMWAGIVLLAVVGLALDAIFTALETRILHWHRGAKRRT